MLKLLWMQRAKGVAGAFYNKNANLTANVVKGAGSYYAEGGPGAGPRVVSAIIYNEGCSEVEKVINGDFEAANGGEWVFAGNAGIISNSLQFLAGPSTAKQDSIFEVGKTYDVSFDVIAGGIGTPVSVYNGSGKDELIVTIPAGSSTPISVEFSPSSGSSDGALFFDSPAGSDIVKTHLDNVSVLEKCAGGASPGKDSIVVTFNGVPGGALNTGVTYTVDGGTATAFASAVAGPGPNDVTYTASSDFAFGEVVRWLYTPGTITVGGEALEAQDVLVDNRVEELPYAIILHLPLAEATGRINFEGTN